VLDKDSCIPHIISRLKKLQIGEKLELTPYKRNRCVLFEKIAEDQFLVKEDGFYKDENRVSWDQITRTLKKILKREFPRSHKIRVYFLSRDEHQKSLKKL